MQAATGVVSRAYRGSCLDGLGSLIGLLVNGLGIMLSLAVGVAQSVEHRTVAPTVAGSIPVSHPKNLPSAGFAVPELSGCFSDDV